jgi:hypothetical protein
MKKFHESPHMIEYVTKVDVSKDPKLAANPNVVPVTQAGLRLAFATSVLQARGFFQENSAERLDGAHPTPLLTWPLLDFLNALALSSTTLIELGAGNSTFAFAKMFARVVSYENNARWAQLLRERLPANVELRAFEGETLAAKSVALDPQDWLLIDFAGKRTRFIKDLLALTNTDARPAVILLDNSDWYRNGARLLSEAGYSEIPFFGLKSGQTWVSCTSFFFITSRVKLEYKTPFVAPAFSRAMSAKWDALD